MQVRPSGRSVPAHADASLERPSARGSKAGNSTAQRQQPSQPAKALPSEGAEDEEGGDDDMAIPDADTIRSVFQP
jgi:hypothetical protein